MFIVLVLLLTVNSAVGDDDCEPGFADTCFEVLVSDIKYMIDLRTMQEINITQYAINELCSTIDDSLNCTSDIIDTDCTDQDGKSEFDSWLSALRGAYHYVCDGTNHQKMTDILHGAPCWSITDFILCTEEKANLPDISHILHVPLNDAECSALKQIMPKCRQKAVVGSCREQEYVFSAVDGMIKAFFDATVCSGQEIPGIGTTSDNPRNVGSSVAALSSIFGTLLQVLVFIFVL